MFFPRDALLSSLNYC